jgi:adenylylsulfate kinase-like enzyme
MNNIRKILILGLPRAGKSTLGKELAKQLNGVWWDADIVRKQIGDDLGFSIEDRIIQSKRMAWLCDTVNEAGHYAVASFVCPTDETRRSFGLENAFVVFLDTIKPQDSPYSDTNILFQKPKFYDMIFSKWEEPSKMAEDVIRELNYAQIKDRKNYII